MKVKLLASLALSAFLASYAVASPYDADIQDMQDTPPLQLADNSTNDTNTLNNNMNANTDTSAPAGDATTSTDNATNGNGSTNGGSSTNDDMNADTATGDDDY